MDGFQVFRLVGGEEDQLPRLGEFRRQHPDVMIVHHAGYWQAVIPEPDGSSTFTRYFLEQLLDKLDEVMA